MRDETARTQREGGFALILAILALMLLTFLGLTLAVTTSTEFQIAVNYRWSQQALYNAEAGIEFAKGYLQDIASWRAVLPIARSTPDMPTAPATFCAGGRPGPGGEASRNCELWECDTNRNAGYGIVLGTNDVSLPFPLQNISNIPGASFNGTFTLWARRRTLADPTNDGLPVDNPADDVLILTAEGTAPNPGPVDVPNRAVRYLEVTLQRIEPGDCENRSGQIGSGPTGSGFDQCDPVRKEGILGGVGEPGAGTQ